jgi:GT2 family glycosyltransferase
VKPSDTSVALTVSIVAFHNPWEQLGHAVESVLAASIPLRLYLVDNSRDDRLRQHISDPRVEYIFNGSNLGFGAGHNLAMQKALSVSRYHLVLNPDVRFFPGTLEKLVYVMDRMPDIGALMPRVLFPDGSDQRLCKRLPTPVDLFSRRFLPPALGGIFGYSPDQYELRDFAPERSIDVPVISGCCMLLRNSVLERAGLFDERFFMYMEDVDLSRRIADHGRVHYAANATIEHGYQKGSYANLRLAWYHIRSAWKYFNKWGWFKDRRRAELNRQVGSVSGQRATTRV